MSTGAPATECTVPGYRVTVVEKNGLLVRFSAHPQPAPQCVGEAHWLPAGGGWAARRDPEGNVHAVHNALFYEAGSMLLNIPVGTCLQVLPEYYW